MLTKRDIQELGNIVDEKLEKRFDPVEKDLKFIKQKMNRINKMLNIVVKNYDEGDMKLEKRMRKIEQHLSLAD